MLTYVHYYTEQGTYLDHGKILDVEPYVGYVVERHRTEGYEPWEIIKIEPNDPPTVFNNSPFIKATVKIHPYVKTHCDHEWINPKPITISQQLTRHCSKCKLKQTFNYGLAKWETVNAT